MMGAGIAYAFAKAGIDVVLKDVSLEGAEKGKAHVDGARRQAVEPRAHDAGEGGRLPRPHHADGDAADLAGCDMIVEAVFEDQALKHRVLSEAEANAAAGRAAGVEHVDPADHRARRGRAAAGRRRGHHFFSPVDKMPLVELIVGERTSPEALAHAYDFVRQIGKTPIVVQDSRGFFTSRVFATFVHEGAALLAEGVAPKSIEQAALQAGFPAGPLTLLDEVTLTLPLKISDEAKKAGSAEDHPGLDVVRALVEQGRTGKSAGQGLLRLGAGEAGVAGPGRALPGHGRRLVHRRPGAAAVRHGGRDGALRRGAGPEQRRGRQHRLDHGHRLPAPRTAACSSTSTSTRAGWPGFVARADELADAYGERFRPPAILLERAVPAGSLRAAVGG